MDRADDITWDAHLGRMIARENRVLFPEIIIMFHQNSLDMFFQGVKSSENGGVLALT